MEQTNKNIKLFRGDSLVELDKVPDKSVQLVIIDPPYKIIQGKSGGAFGKDKQKYHQDISHIVDGFNFQILDKIGRKLERMNMYIFCNKVLLFDLIVHYRTNHPKYLLDVLTWEKINPVPVCHNKYLSDLEYILFVKEKGVRLGGTFQTKHKNYRSPLNVKDKKKYGHPTPKPVDLLNNYIINSSQEGDTVMDVFMGSGSTGESAVSLNRKFIGIEMDETYFETASKRILNIGKDKKNEDND